MALLLKPYVEQLLSTRIVGPQDERFPWCRVMTGCIIQGMKTVSWLNLSSMDSVAFRMMNFQVVEHYSEQLPGILWVTEDTRDRYGISAEKPYFDK